MHTYHLKRINITIITIIICIITTTIVIFIISGIIIVFNIVDFLLLSLILRVTVIITDFRSAFFPWRLSPATAVSHTHHIIWNGLMITQSLGS